MGEYRDGGGLGVTVVMQPKHRTTGGRVGLE